MYQLRFICGILVRDCAAYLQLFFSYKINESDVTLEDTEIGCSTLENIKM